MLSIEVKRNLDLTTSSHSDIVALCIAEADGADSANQVNEFDGVPIHLILTNVIHYEFYFVSFQSWSLLRGMGTVEEGITWNPSCRISVSASERSPDYLG